jgi:clorobiocin biosynthesis protein CloN6
MMDQQVASRLGAGLFLLHAPSVYDFRGRDDMLFACLSDGDSVNVTSVYEMYPIGCFSIKQRLARPGMNAVTGTASGGARVPDQDVYVPSRPRRTISYW